MTGSWLLGKGKVDLMMMILGSVSGGMEGMKVGSVLVYDGMEVLGQKLLSCIAEFSP